MKDDTPNKETENKVPISVGITKQNRKGLKIKDYTSNKETENQKYNQVYTRVRVFMCVPLSLECKFIQVVCY